MSDRPPQSAAASARGRAFLALLVALLGSISAPLDGAVNVAFPSIIRHFGLELGDIRWIPISYVLTYASLLLIFGRLGDLVGHRIVFQAGLSICAFGFAACSLAATFELLLLGRVLQGVGISLVLSCAPALATSLYGEAERVRVLGILAAVTALGGALGPLAGGFLAEQFGWNAVFWARLPLVCAALMLSFMIPARPGRSTASALDTIGSIQLAAALCAILGGASLRVEALGSLTQLGLIGLGALLLVAFFRRQSRVPQPILRPALFRDPLFTMINAASIMTHLAAFCVVLIVPFYLIDVVRMAPGTAGLVLGVAATGMIAGSILAPRLIASAGTLDTAIAGMCCSLLGLGGIAQWSDQAQAWLMLATLLVQGFGLGLFQVAYSDVVTATLPEHERGVAGGLTMLTRSIGIAGGAAVLSMLHQHYAARASLAGAEPALAFMTGFEAVFLIAAGIQGVVLLIAIVVTRLTTPAPHRR